MKWSAPVKRRLFRPSGSLMYVRYTFRRKYSDGIIDKLLNFFQNDV